jgi:transposase-like protein
METNLINLMEQFGTDERCRAELQRLRWPEGPRCPRCDSSRISRIIKRNQFDCDACRYQFSVTAGTLFNDSHLPLWKWFLATYMMCESKKGISACQIQRTLGIGGYKTAWYLCHRIRAAMQEVDSQKLDGVVEIDETYVGGKPRRNRPRVIKEVVVGIRQREGKLRFIRAKDIKATTIREIIREHVGDDVEVIITDEAAVYPWALRKEQRAKHKTICHKSEYVHGDVHTNTVESSFSLLKRGILGTWHRISVKHLPAYLNEVAFRFNNRKNPRMFQDVLKRLLQTKAMPFYALTKEEAA